MNIKTITASWGCISEKSDKYTLLCMIHQMAGMDAAKRDSQWQLKETATYDHYIMTTYTNGICDLTAETFKSEGGEPYRHDYKLTKAEK